MIVKQQFKKKSDYRADIHDAKVRIAITKWELGNSQKENKFKKDKRKDI